MEGASLPSPSKVKLQSGKSKPTKAFDAIEDDEVIELDDPDIQEVNPLPSQARSKRVTRPLPARSTVKGKGKGSTSNKPAPVRPDIPVHGSEDDLQDNDGNRERDVESNPTSSPPEIIMDDDEESVPFDFAQESQIPVVRGPSASNVASGSGQTYEPRSESPLTDVTIGAPRVSTSNSKAKRGGKSSPARTRGK